MARNSSLMTLVTWLAVGTAVVLGGGCESRAPTATRETAAVPLRITAVTVGTPISTLIIEVDAADLPSSLVFNLTVQNGVASGTIKVPPGPARTIHVTAVDDQGTVTHDGSVTVDVRPGQNPPVQVILRPRSGQIPITVTFGNYTVLVAPTAATIDPSVTSQLQLTPTVIDVDGQHIASPQVGWATTQPAVAVVDQNGLVTGIANGTATIVATFEGVAGLSAITVIGNEAPLFNVASAASTGNTSMTVTFDGPPNLAQATSLDNYNVPGLILSGAALSANTVTLTTSSQAATLYTVTVTGVTRINDGEPLTVASASFTGTAPALVMTGGVASFAAFTIFGDSVAVTQFKVLNEGFRSEGPYTVAICLSQTLSIAGCTFETAIDRPLLEASGEDDLPTIGLVAPRGFYHVFAWLIESGVVLDLHEMDGGLELP
jgi:Big-like domain-containing protein